MVNKFVNSVAVATVGIAMCLTSSVAAAATVPVAIAAYAPSSISPFVALSAYGTMQSRSAVCGAAVGAAAATAATAGQPQPQGCVLPQLDRAPPVAVEIAPLAPPVAYAPAFGLGIGALLAGLVLVAGLAAVLLSGHNNGRLPISPD